MSSQPADMTSGGRVRCPVCGRPGEPRYAPFCSKRCADVDLARWLRGAYAIPDEGDSEDGQAAPVDPADDSRDR